jgi:hypothetical protein
MTSTINGCGVTKRGKRYQSSTAYNQVQSSRRKESDIQRKVINNPHCVNLRLSISTPEKSVAHTWHALGST